MTASIYYICVDASDYRIIEMNTLAQLWHKITQGEIEKRRPTILDFHYPSQGRILECIDEVRRTQKPVDFSHNIQSDYVEGPGLWKVEFHPSPVKVGYVYWFAVSLDAVVDSVVESFGSVPDGESV